MTGYVHPHVAVTVSDFEATKSFYASLGFKTLVENFSEEKQRHFMLLEGYGLEMEVFYFTNQPEGQTIAEDDLQRVGIKHVALPVDDVTQLRNSLVGKGIELLKDINVSSLGVSNFNVKDPSGLVLEFFQVKG
ncbi:MAG TPA: VOC family protein [Candidatus Saccharimonadales bacterium]|nr:VOC family protein [Candidatus Saccharimonadales bacterium]